MFQNQSALTSFNFSSDVKVSVIIGMSRPR